MMKGDFSYWSWRTMTREQVTLSIARGLDIAPSFSGGIGKAERDRRLAEDMRRYPLNTIFPMAVVTAATCFLILSLIIACICVLIWTDVPWWVGLLPTALMATCWLLGSRYVRGYNAVYRKLERRS